jgi:SAM-dependent methyltransferase
MEHPLSTENPFDLESVFEADDYLYFYSDSLTDERSDREVASLVKLLDLHPPMKILDLACGFGRHANRLAALGYSVTGIDQSADFLNLARKHARKMSVHVNYLQADMRRLEFVEEFDAVIMMFTTFGYFNDDDNFRVLENIARALKLGGTLGFDIPNRDATLKTLLPAVVVEKNGDLMINRNSFDMVSGRWQNQRIVIRNGIRKDKPFSIRLYNPTEIGELVEKAGMKVSHLYGDWSGQPLSTESRGVVVLAQKPPS